MTRNEICCDVCGSVVARKDGTIFARYEITRPYVEVPYHYNGMSYDYGSFPSKTTKHICHNCMETFVLEALEEKEEQSK